MHRYTGRAAVCRIFHVELTGGRARAAEIAKVLLITARWAAVLARISCVRKRRAESCRTGSSGALHDCGSARPHIQAAVPVAHLDLELASCCRTTVAMSSTCTSGGGWAGVTAERQNESPAAWLTEAVMRICSDVVRVDERSSEACLQFGKSRKPYSPRRLL